MREIPREEIREKEFTPYTRRYRQDKPYFDFLKAWEAEAHLAATLTPADATNLKRKAPEPDEAPVQLDDSEDTSKRPTKKAKVTKPQPTATEAGESKAKSAKAKKRARSKANKAAKKANALNA